MEDVSTIDEIDSLTVLELKQILTANFIDYKGCVEKKELIDKVKMLYESREKNKERLQGWLISFSISVSNVPWYIYVSRNSFFKVGITKNSYKIQKKEKEFR